MLVTRHRIIVKNETLPRNWTGGYTGYSACFIFGAAADKRRLRGDVFGRQGAGARRLTVASGARRIGFVLLTSFDCFIAGHF
jgi:hypothetical protein